MSLGCSIRAHRQFPTAIAHITRRKNPWTPARFSDFPTKGTNDASYRSPRPFIPAIALTHRRDHRRYRVRERTRAKLPLFKLLHATCISFCRFITIVSPRSSKAISLKIRKDTETKRDKMFNSYIRESRTSLQFLCLCER